MCSDRRSPGQGSFVWVRCHGYEPAPTTYYRTPYEKRHGSTPDISAYILFTFWEKILYYDAEQSYPNSKELPGYFLGVARNSGDALTLEFWTILGGF